jgi:HD-like signal output (HDOD) protein/prolyl-tRNA editing enzyme YbaK/EbsC (Cys-tRNA(Pro) deacylase)
MRALATNVKHFLDHHRVSYRILNHERTNSLAKTASILDIDQSQVIKAVLLKESSGFVLAVLPLNYQLDLARLSLQMNQFFEIVTAAESDKFFRDCEPGVHTPFGEAYGISLILDKSIEKLEMVYLEVGSHTTLIQLSMDDFQFLTSGAPYLSFAVPKCANENEEDNEEEFKIFNETKSDTKETFEVIETIKNKMNFSTLPLIARQILEIANKDIHESERLLSQLILNDTVINNHILYYARQCLDGEEHDCSVESMSEVITHALGFETVSHMALGIAAGRALQVPETGPIGLKAFWRHAVYCATLAQKIAAHIPQEVGVDLSLSYLVGLFHNFGYLVLGNLFASEFHLLNKWVMLNPKTPVEILEKRLFGIRKSMCAIGCGHAQLGAALMQYWEMPEPIIAAARFHHKMNYNGKYAPYISVIQLTNQLLKTVGLGDGDSSIPIPKLLTSLGISMAVVEESMNNVQKEINHLDTMAMGLAN